MEAVPHDLRSIIDWRYGHTESVRVDVCLDRVHELLGRYPPLGEAILECPVARHVRHRVGLVLSGLAGADCVLPGSECACLRAFCDEPVGTCTAEDIAALQKEL